MYKIYINNITVFLIDNPQVIDIDFIDQSHILIVKYKSIKQIQKLVITIEEQDAKVLFIVHDNIKALKKVFL